jgi:hypothetical protein
MSYGGIMNYEIELEYLYNQTRQVADLSLTVQMSNSVIDCSSCLFLGSELKTFSMKACPDMTARIRINRALIVSVKSYTRHMKVNQGILIVK